MLVFFQAVGGGTDSGCLGHGLSIFGIWCRLNDRYGRFSSSSGLYEGQCGCRLVGMPAL